MKKIVTLLTAMSAISSSAAFATTIHVPGDSVTIQAGINGAVNGDTVLVADGTYMGDGNRDIDFGGTNIVLKSENGPEFTIIVCQGYSANEHRGFNFHSGEDSTAVVDGFTITGGYGFGGIYSSDAGGGGIICEGSSPTLINMVIKGNITGPDQWGSSDTAHGGGILCKYFANPTIIYSIISENEASGSDNGGGGIACVHNSNPTISNTIISGNIAEDGSAIYCANESSPIINNCTIVEHGSLWGGVVLYSWDASGPHINNSIIAFNNSYAIFSCGYVDNPVFTCTNIYGNDGGDWVGCIADQADTNGNFSADPLFCDTANADYNISSASPCAPANNSCGELVGALGVACGEVVTIVHFDIKPGSCPNPLNFNGNHARGKAVLPAAILGTEEFDVRDIDPTTLELIGVSPKRWSYEDVAGPTAEPNDSCASTEDGPDGYKDLTLKFDRAAVIDALNDLPIQGQVILTVTGQLNDGSSFEGSDCIKLLHKRVTGISSIDNGEIPKEFKLVGNFPNPFNPSTTIEYSIPMRSHVTITVHNLLGQSVTTLADGPKPSGRHTVSWDGTDARGRPVASGIYLYRIKAGDFTDTRKMVLLK